MVFAKALQAVNEDVLVDGGVSATTGVTANKLIALQNADGYWVNSNRGDAEQQGAGHGLYADGHGSDAS
jgi:hypothetical protein